ncbi:hypothetical protein BJ878DRAFT_480632 [Calycina marina]|uniref:Uncharacterized protein n=1 Tax=Calycina marina TaxID=1763456 RepID=A0A9P7Z256_9HELO|nr:hypothetical protein BJ878DRAFT_480632 [Calycina marina]
MLPVRQSSRASVPPARLWFEKTYTPPLSAPNTLPDNSDTLLPTIEDQNTEDEFTDAMVDNNPPPGAVSFTAEQEAILDQRIAAAAASAVRAALATRSPPAPAPAPRPTPSQSQPRQTTPTLEPERSRRVMTADLQPLAGYYVPHIQPGSTTVKSHKVRYPRIAFSDHQGEIQNDSWKMDMKLFLEDYPGNFYTGDE